VPPFFYSGGVDKHRFCFCWFCSSRLPESLCIFIDVFVLILVGRADTFGRRHLRAFATDSACKLDILGHDRHALGMDGREVGVLEEANKVSLSRLLERKDGGSLEAEIGLEVLGNLTDKALEWQLADQKLGGLLVTSDLTKSDGSRSVPVRLLDATRGRRGLACGLGCQLLSRGLATGTLACCLLSACHCF
jgi:hypothetical protein